MNLSTQPYKGARDFYPEDKRVQKYMFGILRRVVESYGYLEYDAPIIEPLELYLAKSSEEIVTQQTYSFVDRGGRNVTLRPEMTPTVSRMVAARRQELAYPARLYSIPNLWRYERPQAGRLREHWQLNVDLFGVEGIAGDFEIIQLADSILKEFGAKDESYSIKINSRLLINWLLLEYLGLEKAQTMAVVRLVDNKNKMPQAQFRDFLRAMLTPTQIQNDVEERLLQLFKVEKLEELPPVVHQHPAVAELAKLFQLLKDAGVKSAVFDLSLMRGFDYYTNIVFEVFDHHPDNNRSMFGGGRYDGLVGQFGVEPVATVGFGMGDVTLHNFLVVHKLLPKLHSETDAVMIFVGNVFEPAQKMISELRKEGVRLAVDTTGRKLDAQIKSAVKSGTHYVIFIGEKELEEKRFRLKDLTTGQEEEHSLERTVSILASQHKTEVTRD